MRFNCLLVTALSLLSLASAKGSTFDAVTDFSSSNPSGAWTYGQGSTGSSFSPLPAFSNNGCFATPGIACWQPSTTFNGAVPAVARNQTASAINFITVVLPTDVLLAHPGPSSDVIIDWTAPSAGTYNISGFFELLDISPTGVIGEIFNGTNQLFTGTLTGPAASQTNETVGGRESFSLAETVTAGTIISFGVNNDGDYNYDSTGFDATITSADAKATPEPASALLLILGFAGLYALRLRPQPNQTVSASAAIVLTAAYRRNAVGLR